MKLGNLGLYAESSKTINHAAFFVLCGRELTSQATILRPESGPVLRPGQATAF